MKAECKDNKIIFIIGGCRSGKSRFAMQMTRRQSPPVGFLATARPIDGEMRERIRGHRARRPKTWRTFEIDGNLPAGVRRAAKRCRTLLLDCVTLWASGCLSKPAVKIARRTGTNLPKQLESAVKIARRSGTNLIMVANEVGEGIVPPTEIGRAFRDVAGELNQSAARLADEVYQVVCGIPVRIK